MEESGMKFAAKWVAFVLAVLLGLFLVTLVSWGLYKPISRYQKRADAQNSVSVSRIEIQNQEQRAKVAQQQADIRYITATGIRRAQDEIASSLTPLYVQFEMISTLQEIAKSGKNNSIIYIPVGANGVPLVSVTGQPQVLGGDSGGG